MSDPWARPFDAALLSLRLNGFEHRLMPAPPPDANERALAGCPRCLAGLALTITEHFEPGGPVTIECENGCTEPQVRARLRTLDAAREELEIAA